MFIGQRGLRNRARIPSNFDIPGSKLDIDFDTAKSKFGPTGLAFVLLAPGLCSGFLKGGFRHWPQQ
jgi:hypothetical protein